MEVHHEWLVSDELKGMLKLQGVLREEWGRDGCAE